MNTITIDDPRVFQGGELFAKANHSTLKELVNKYVASLAANFYSSRGAGKTEESLIESEDFKKAMVFHYLIQPHTSSSYHDDPLIHQWLVQRPHRVKNLQVKP